MDSIFVNPVVGQDLQDLTGSLLLLILESISGRNKFEAIFIKDEYRVFHTIGRIHHFYPVDPVRICP